MKVDVLFCVYAHMTVELDDDKDMEQYERDFGNCDNQFEIESVDSVYILSTEVLKDEDR